MLTAFVKRKKDVPLFRFGLNASILFITALLSFTLKDYLVLLFIHLLLYILYVGRVITMYHDINHFPLLKKKVYNSLFVGVLGLLYGFTPHTYFAHHIIMHHPENNEYDDVSTTLPYKRDSIRDFIRYYLKFFISVYGLTKYLNRQNSGQMRIHGKKAVAGELFYIVLLVLTLLYRPWVAIFVFIIPFFVTRSLLIMGNWGEHAFIDPVDYRNLYRSSTNILGKYNEKSFNVGYHIGHHLKPSLHYSQLPEDFEKNLEVYIKEDAMIFTDLHYPHIWFYLMLKKYRKLAEFYVRLPNAPARTTDEIIALMKWRTQAIPRQTN
jgi:fatty acid desaturase